MDVNLSVAEKRLLLALRTATGPVHPGQLMRQVGVGISHQVETIASNLERLGLVTLRESWVQRPKLTDEGWKFKEAGLPERQLARLLAKSGGRLATQHVMNQLGAIGKVAIGWGMRKGWTGIEDSGGQSIVFLISGEPSAGEDERTLLQLSSIIDSPPATSGYNQLVARKTIIEPGNIREVSVELTSAGKNVASAIIPEELETAIEVNQVTPELIAKWPTLSAAERAKHVLRPFDFNVPVAVPSPGKAHPLTHIITEIRDIFVSMGFTEIAGDYVEPAFWNMDALFIPQDHPARDMQDTFYLKSPAKAPVPDKMFEAVRDVQQKGGGTGSTGWGGSFKREESERTLLRTHTTVTTIRHLAAHPKPPVRVFGIGRVFRNEAMDATHLPEFHQVEGIIVEEGATLSMLMGVLREFYKRMGFPDIKFRPSFYPYTEPSLDVAVKWGDRWLELGGAGVFRPEVTKPLGVPTNVLAWGLGLERLAMLRLGLKDIRQLYLSDVQWLRETPVR